MACNYYQVKLFVVNVFVVSGNKLAINSPQFCAKTTSQKIQWQNYSNEGNWCFLIFFLWANKLHAGDVLRNKRSDLHFRPRNACSYKHLMKMCSFVLVIFLTFEGVNVNVRLLMLWWRSKICDQWESNSLSRQSQSIDQACNSVRNCDLYISQFRKLISCWTMLVLQAPVSWVCIQAFRKQRFKLMQLRKA